MCNWDPGKHSKARQHYQIGHDCIEGKVVSEFTLAHTQLSKAKWWQRVIRSTSYKQEQKIHETDPHEIASCITQISPAAYREYKTTVSSSF